MGSPLRMLMEEDELLKHVVAPVEPRFDATMVAMKVAHQCVSSSGFISPSYLSTILAVLLVAVGVVVADEPRAELSGFRGNGGRVAWSPTGEFIVFDRKGADGGFDLYLTEDFETERCLTCNHPDLPNPKRNYGQPAIHPNGRYVVFQAEKQEHPFIIPLATNPGAGVFNDLSLYDLETGRAAVLWEVPNDKHHGVLHPQFSKDGRQLSWSEMVGGADFKVPGKGAGEWVLKTADFSPRGLTNVKQHRPGEDVIYENHGFSHDGEWLFFSSNMKRSRAVNEATDIYKLHLGTGELVRLTDEGYNEHAHLSPDGKYIVWMSSVGLGDTYDYYRVGTEYWLMNADGSGKRRLTNLNDPDHPHFRGRYAIVADFDFSPTSSEETGYRLLAYLHELVTKNLSIPSNNPSAKGEYNFFVDFTLGSATKPPTPSNPMIHAVGTRLVDGNGDPIQLRGVLLEGWLMWNGPLWGAGLVSETKLSERIEGLVGREEAARFRKAVYDTFITERDIEMIADLGFNVVRVPFNHTVLEKNRAVDDSAPGWFYLDRLLNWCEKHQVYVVLDLHSVPKGQSGVFVADPDAKHVWTSEKDLQRTVDIWKAIAARYRDRSIVAGYDLINEPEPPKDHELIDLYRRIIQAIRLVDPHHLVFLTGKTLSTDFRIFDGPLDDNQAYTFHTYNFFSHDVDEANLAKISSIARRHNVPLWNGEFGAHTDRWTSSQVELFEDPGNHVNGWIYWPWKRVSETDWRRERFSHLMEIESTKAWDTVRKHLASIFGWKKIPKNLARRALADFIEASKAENLVADERMVTALQSWQRPSADSPTPKPSGDEFVRKVESPRSLTRHVDNIKVVRADGGRVSWHLQHDLIAFDVKGDDGIEVTVDETHPRIGVDKLSNDSLRPRMALEDFQIGVGHANPLF
jgi:aryl-phospho-beta-D-glucosidase BglC (GH1 family)